MLLHETHCVICQKAPNLYYDKELSQTLDEEIKKQSRGELKDIYDQCTAEGKMEESKKGDLSVVKSKSAGVSVKPFDEVGRDLSCG